MNPSGVVSVYTLLHTCHKNVLVWRVPADSSCIWLRLLHVKVSGSEVYMYVTYVAPSSSIVTAGNCPYDTLQTDIVDAQNAGGCIIVCGDMNARTEKQDDYARLADL